jgi:tetratricopeptide (TPR) repeat protein
LAFTLSSIANNYNQTEKYTEAEEFYRLALKIRIDRLDKDHPDIAKTLWNLGAFFYKRGKYGNAKFCLATALPVFEKEFGLLHSHTQALLSWINKLPPETEALPPEELGL